MSKRRLIAFAVSIPFMICLVVSGFLFAALAWPPLKNGNNVVIAAAAVKSDTGNVNTGSAAENEESAMITVNFVREDASGEEISLGTAVLTMDGVLDVSGVTDTALAKRLQRPYNATVSRMEGGKILTEMAVCEPGTKEHLLGIAMDLKLESELDFIPHIEDNSSDNE